MATVNVTSWTEFLEAAAVSGDTVVCPENAVWDIGDIEPEGHSGCIELKATINGNGTKIKNLVIQNASDTVNGVIRIYNTVTDLHFSDSVWAVNGKVIQFENNNAICQLCTFSASAQGGTTVYLFGTNSNLIGSQNKAIVYRCAANVEFANATNVWVHGYNVEGKYNNIKMSGSRVSSCTLCSVSTMNTNGKLGYSMVTLDMPALTTLSGSTFSWGLIRCTGANVGDLRNVSTGVNVSLACSDDFPAASQISSGLALCSETQLRDAAYLQSIGFPIGVEY